MNDAIELLTQMVSIPSVSGSEAAISAWLTRRLSELGFEATQDDVGNAIGIKATPNDAGRIEREVMLLGHMDTVPGLIEVRTDDGKLFGRGSVDAKGSLATFVIAAANHTPKPGTRVVVAGAVEEEVSSSKGARRIAEKFHPDVCVIGEPSGWNALTLGYKGCLQLKYTSRRPCGHTAGAEKGAAELGCDWWNRLAEFAEEFNSDRERLFDQLLPALRSFNTASDGLYDEVTAHVGVRLPPEFDSEAFIGRAREWDANASILALGYEAAHATKRTTSIANTFKRVLAARGERMTAKLKTGTSDMNVVAPVWNCPIVAYGPGDSQLDHTPDEHLSLAEFEQAVSVLKGVLDTI